MKTIKFLFVVLLLTMLVFFGVTVVKNYDSGDTEPTTQISGTETGTDSGSGDSSSDTGDTGSGDSGSDSGDTGSGDSGSDTGDTDSGDSGSDTGDTGSTECTTHNYDYANIKWEWSSDYSSCTATVYCSVCGDEYVQSATVTSTVGSSKTVYTATITVDGIEYTSTKTISTGIIY